MASAVTHTFHRCTNIEHDVGPGPGGGFTRHYDLCPASPSAPEDSSDARFEHCLIFVDKSRVLDGLHSTRRLTLHVCHPFVIVHSTAENACASYARQMCAFIWMLPFLFITPCRGGELWVGVGICPVRIEPMRRFEREEPLSQPAWHVQDKTEPRERCFGGEEQAQAGREKTSAQRAREEDPGEPEVST